jgi:mono/diheme cytochrome c family protein
MRLFGVASVALTLALTFAISPSGSAQSKKQNDGQEIFRYDTFGDEQLWTDVLGLHEAIESVSPAAALAVGLKVDADALLPPIVRALQRGQLDVGDPAVTLRLLRLNAVVGVVADVTGTGVRRLGVTCALCHSTVDDSVAPGIGRRLDGWPNLDLNVGAIVGLSKSPAVAPFLGEFAEWGPGKYDARHHAFDGSNLILRHSPSIPVVIPPAYGLQGVGFETYTGDGPISYWNAYVGVTQMGGKGFFSDPRIGLAVSQTPDLVTSKLPALLAYQMSLSAPAPPAGTFEAIAAARGEAVFNDAALGLGQCSRCHIAPTYTDVSSGPVPQVPVLHTAAEIGADTVYAMRSATGAYRTTPLRALWQHAPYFHDGRAASLLDVVNHYDGHFTLNLTRQQKADLVEFLKSL